MLKMYAKGERDGKDFRLVILGLSYNNLEELKKGRPILIKGSTIGLEDDIELLIFSGKDELTMKRDFSQFIGPKTEVHIDPKLGD
jgi:hypothetical protein